MQFIKRLEYWITGEPKWASQLQEIEDRVDHEINTLLTDTDDKCLEKVLTTLKDRRSALHIQPEFTHLIVSVCGQILAFGSAGVGLMVAFANKIPAFTPFWKSIISVSVLFYLDVMLIALFALVLFFLQSRSRYPFLFLKKLGNTAPYFYMETLKRERSITLWWPLHTPSSIFAFNRLYLDDLKNYVEYSVNETERDKLKIELRQIYLLINYQGFLDHYEMQLGHVFLYGFIGSIGSLVFLYKFFL
ncbi:hypothetical protein [Parachryseolinea silvisoli]|uniref:hypothetical protein n=1 Tax=Parachryseolinea silvisoli TaxID=2873601 RepID=UPI002265D1C0|nr:hypothetical protein [Parachryseolinea silvisoli]MCD9019148.1 hypothetical protein [Parachryseolinea silvisoli]